MSAEPTLPKEIVEAVKYLAAASYDAGKHGATASSSVTDASKELGFAIAKALGEKDEVLAAASRQRDSLAAHCNELEALGHKYLAWAESCDYLLPNHEALKKAFQSLLHSTEKQS